MRDHDSWVEQLAEQRENEFNDVYADHTDEFPDPEPVNGRVPDVVVDDGFSFDVVEVDSKDTQAEREQASEIKAGLGLFDDFDRVVLNEEQDDSGGLFF